jgi:nicotinic acid mononucleotide adenylyltransferase
MMDIFYDRYGIDCSESMILFAGEDETFEFSEWRKWREDCEKAEQLLDPELYKVKKTLQ